MSQAPLHTARSSRSATMSAAIDAFGPDVPFVDILGVRFPLLDQATAVRELVDGVRRGDTRAVAFPDMSTMNIAAEDTDFLRLLQRRVITLNDGAGLAMVARMRRRPFPANLNGTDLCPALFESVPAGTSVYLVGAHDGVAARARDFLALRYPHVRFVGADHGYLQDPAVAAEVVEQLHRLKPQIVLVAMGNPLQVRYIDRHLDDPELRGTLWLAVGGQLDYYGGKLVRAPAYIRWLRLEWLHLVIRQPHKMRRYLAGIPIFVARCLIAQVRSSHVSTREVNR